MPRTKQTARKCAPPGGSHVYPQPAYTPPAQHTHHTFVPRSAGVPAPRIAYAARKSAPAGGTREADPTDAVHSANYLRYLRAADDEVRARHRARERVPPPPVDQPRPKLNDREYAEITGPKYGLHAAEFDSTDEWLEAIIVARRTEKEVLVRVAARGTVQLLKALTKATGKWATQSADELAEDSDDETEHDEETDEGEDSEEAVMIACDVPNGTKRPRVDEDLDDDEVQYLNSRPTNRRY